MDFDFPPDALMLQDMLRRFVQKEALPLEMKYFTTKSLEPKERDRLRQAVDQLGLWGLTVPEEFGGGGLDLVTTCLIEEELGRTFLPLELGEVPQPLYTCNPEQAGLYLEPALAGERHGIVAVREPGQIDLRPGSWKTSAHPKNGGFILQGHKLLNTLPGANDFLIVFAQHTNGPTSFLIDIGQPGLVITESDGIHVILNDCQIGAEALLGEPGNALKASAKEAWRGWIKISARYTGLGERLLSMAIDHSKNWISFDAPLAQRPSIQRMLAEMRVEIESCRWLTYHAAWMTDGGKKPEEFRYQAALVRMAAGEMLKHVVERTTMIFSGPGPDLSMSPESLTWSIVPPEALEFALNQARAVITQEILSLQDG